MRTVIAWLSLVLFIGLMITGVMFLHPFGEPVAPVMDDYMIANAQSETGSNNVVTAILFDYRGFDTLGEATVLFAAVAGVLLTLRAIGKKKDTD